MTFRYLTFAIFAALSANSLADNALLLHLNSGEIIRFELNSRPIITFNQNLMTVGSQNYSFSDVNKYTFATQTSINNILDDNIIVFNGDGHIKINGNYNASEIQLYSIEGINYPLSISSNSDNSFTVDISSLHTGYYIIKLGSKRIKIHKR